tara:strand:+ start:1339 stop:2259 length:921 start_codon:yes stop_codon:yes gene_type:complete
MNKKKTFPKKKTEVNTGVLEPVEAEVDFKVPPMPKKSNNPFANNPFNKTSEKPSIYQLIKGRKKDRSGRWKYPVVYMIRAEDVIYDPIKQVNRKIRYIPGEASIYEDEQKKDSKVRAPITFSEGFITVSNQNPTLKNYLDVCNANKNNPNRMKNSAPSFQLVDKSSDAKKIIDREMKEIDAMQLALKMPFGKLVGYAKVLGVNVDKSTEEIRYDMKMLAKKDPNSFIAGLDDPKTAIKEVIVNAREYGIIDIQVNRVSWKRGNERVLITHIPVGVNGVNHFADFCLDGDGELVLEEMKKQIAKFNS